MKAILTRLLQTVLGTSLLLSMACVSSTAPDKPYFSAAYRPTNPANVEVKVSLENKMVYVLEGDKALLVTPTAIGRAEKPTPKGKFTAYRKEKDKRSYTYGFHVKSDSIAPGKSANTPSGARYVGYPLPYWVEFKPAYGFHAGSVWPIPRSAGCLRLHPNVAPKFFDMVKEGTPVHIADTQPEDATLGKNIPWPTDYDDPDPPASVTITHVGAFPSFNESLYEEGPAPTL